MSTLEVARALFLRFQSISLEKSTYNRLLYQYMSCQAASVSDKYTAVSFKMTVEPFMLDTLTNVLHTGAIAAIVDGCTSMCMILGDPLHRSPVSVNLYISNFNPPGVGSVLDIDTKCWYSDNLLGQTTARLTSGGTLVASATQRHILYPSHPSLFKIS
jgi:acyl-coenzyme A thioesterase PaaI-like protein